MSYIKFGLFLGVIISIVSLIIFGLLHNPTPGTVDLGNHKKGVSTKQCGKIQVSCPGEGEKGNSYCESTCEVGVEYKCSKIGRGDGEFVCAPAEASAKCNTDLGGILTWEASDSGDMEWGCICLDPNIAAAQGSNSTQTIKSDLCQVNPNICGGPNNPGFTWTVKNTDPYYKSCKKCEDGDTMMLTKDGSRPICVPSTKTQWYSDLLTMPP